VSLDRWINLLVPITLIEMMLAIGLGVTHAQVLAVARNWRLVTRAAAANYILVPAATVGLLLAFHATSLVAAGFLILAVCPGAPYGPPATAIAKGNVSIAVGLMIILAGSSAIVAPLLLRVLLPLIAGGQSGQLGLAKIAVTLLVTQLIPLCAGLGIRHWFPAAAARSHGPANRLSALLNLSVVILILIAQYRMLLAIRMRGVIGMLMLLTISLAIGWLLGRAEDRKAMTFSTSIRNVGVGLVIAASAFPNSPAMTAILAYGLTQVLGSILIAYAWSHFKPAPQTDKLLYPS
jgi:BASS family bile acid:Na+ symporter